MSFRAFVAAYLLGLSVAAPIGPVNVEIIRRGLRVGPMPAFFLGCGAVSADCAYLGLALVATELARSITGSAIGMRLILLVGGGLLIWIGVMSIRSKTEISEAGARTKGAPLNMLGSYLFGLAMTLTNPMTIVLWLSIAGSLSAGSSGGSPAVLLAGVFSGTISWVIFIVALLAWARRWVNARFLHLVNVASGICLIGYGLKFWVQALRWSR